ncbi:hypothetical protein MKX03_012060, partial [Papaver bracteatum]
MAPELTDALCGNAGQVRYFAIEAAPTTDLKGDCMRNNSGGMRLSRHILEKHLRQQAPCQFGFYV